ncbi:MAG: hypothetical protein MO846_10100 [Candidatus Devosia symbiotica]|nr:hypothetical protein [Candidatus Devosia symbiotica]
MDFFVIGQTRRRWDGLFDDFWIEPVGLVGTEHVVIAGDDTQIEQFAAGKLRLLGGCAGGKGLGEIVAGENGAIDAGLASAFKTVEIIAKVIAAACRNAIGNILDDLMDRHRRAPGSWSPSWPKRSIEKH